MTKQLANEFGKSSFEYLKRGLKEKWKLLVKFEKFLNPSREATRSVKWQTEKDHELNDIPRVRFTNFVIVDLFSLIIFMSVVY